MGSKKKYYEQMAEIIAEIGTESAKDFRATVEMERGTAEEQFAIKRYEEITGEKVIEVGICISDSNKNETLSPDGLVQKIKK
jgi:hypothetical protein